MAKKPKRPKPEDIETLPDAWERFEKAIDGIVKPKKPIHADGREGSDDRTNNGKHPSCARPAALALADKHHKWTQTERRAYEAAVRFLS